MFPLIQFYNIIKSWFYKNETIKNFSTTLTDASEGTNSLGKLNPALTEKISKELKAGAVSIGTTMEAMEFFLNTKRIDFSRWYKLNPEMVNLAIFRTEHLHYNRDTDGTVTDIYVTLSEESLGHNLKIRLSVKDFREIFKPVHFPNSFEKETQK